MQLPRLGTGPHSEGPQACSPPRQTPCRLGRSSRLLTRPCHRGGWAQARRERQRSGTHPSVLSPIGHTQWCPGAPRQPPGPRPPEAPPKPTSWTEFIGCCPTWGCEGGTLQTGTWDTASSQHWRGCQVTGGGRSGWAPAGSAAVLSPRRLPGLRSVPPLLPPALQQPLRLCQGAGPRPGLSLESSVATLAVLWPFCSV